MDAGPGPSGWPPDALAEQARLRPAVIGCALACGATRLGRVPIDLPPRPATERRSVCKDLARAAHGSVAVAWIPSAYVITYALLVPNRGRRRHRPLRTIHSHGLVAVGAAPSAKLANDARQGAVTRGTIWQSPIQ